MEIPAPITFRVEGMAPAPQGSKRHVGRGIMVESSKNVGLWRQRVQAAAVATGIGTLDGPLSLSIVFLFLRPKGHYNGKGELKANAPRWHTSRPDTSKLVRSTEDALVDAGLVRDDSLFCMASQEKRYCRADERPGALITIIPLPGSKSGAVQP